MSAPRPFLPTRSRMFVSALLVVNVCAITLDAQQIAPVAVHSLQMSIAAQTPAQLAHPAGPLAESYTLAVPARLLLGAGGALAGGYAGAFAAIATAQHSCDGPCIGGLGQVVVGSVIGAAIVGAAPRFNSTCSRAKRIALGLLGSALGGAAGGAAGFSSRNFDTLFLASFVGSGAGSALGAVLCDLTE